MSCFLVMSNNIRVDISSSSFLALEIDESVVLKYQLRWSMTWLRVWSIRLWLTFESEQVFRCQKLTKLSCLIYVKWQLRIVVLLRIDWQTSTSMRSLWKTSWILIFSKKSKSTTKDFLRSKDFDEVIILIDEMMKDLCKRFDKNTVERNALS